MVRGIRVFGVPQTRRRGESKGGVSGGKDAEGVEQFRDGAGPIVEVGLTEEAHRGVPGGVGAGDEPAPFGDEGEDEPDGLAHGGGEVGC